MTQEFDGNGRLEEMAVTVAMPGDEYEVTFHYDRGSFSCTWSPSEPGSDVSPEFIELFGILGKGFVDTVATLVGQPVILAGNDGEPDYIAHPQPADAFDTVH